MYNDHPWDLKIVTVVDKWSLFKGQLFNKCPNGTSIWWSLKIDGRYSEVVVISGWTWVFCYKQTFECITNILGLHTMREKLEREDKRENYFACRKLIFSTVKLFFWSNLNILLFWPERKKGQ